MQRLPNVQKYARTSAHYAQLPNRFMTNVTSGIVE